MLSAGRLTSRRLFGTTILRSFGTTNTQDKFLATWTDRQLTFSNANGKVHHVSVPKKDVAYLKSTLKADSSVKTVEVKTLDGLTLGDDVMLEDLRTHGIRLSINDVVLRLPREGCADVADVDAADLEERLVKLRDERKRLQLLVDSAEGTARRRAALFAWSMAGVAYAQFGGMLYGTYWLYSWDIMEPISFFLGAFDAACAATYFAFRHRNFSMQHHADQLRRERINKYLAKHNVQYEDLEACRQQISLLEFELAVKKATVLGQPIPPKPSDSAATSTTAASASTSEEHPTPAELKAKLLKKDE